MSQLADFDQRRTTAPRTYQPKALNAQHHEILRLNLLGWSAVRIAEELKCTTAVVSYTLNSGLGRQQSTLLKAEADINSVEVAKAIREMAPKALETLREIMEDTENSATVRARVADSILSRAGFDPIKKIATGKLETELTIDDLEVIKHNALARAIESGIVLDVSPEVLNESE